MKIPVAVKVQDQDQDQDRLEWRDAQAVATEAEQELKEALVRFRSCPEPPLATADMRVHLWLQVHDSFCRLAAAGHALASATTRPRSARTRGYRIQKKCRNRMDFVREQLRSLSAKAAPGRH